MDDPLTQWMYMSMGKFRANIFFHINNSIWTSEPEFQKLIIFVFIFLFRRLMNNKILVVFLCKHLFVHQTSQYWVPFWEINFLKMISIWSTFGVLSSKLSSVLKSIQIHVPIAPPSQFFFIVYHCSQFHKDSTYLGK